MSNEFKNSTNRLNENDNDNVDDDANANNDVDAKNDDAVANSSKSGSTHCHQSIQNSICQFLLFTC